MDIPKVEIESTADATARGSPATLLPLCVGFQKKPLGRGCYN